MLFDDDFVESLPEDTAHAVLDVFRHFREFNEEIVRDQAAQKDKLISTYRFAGDVFEDYLRSYSFLQSFARKHDLSVNISDAPLSPPDLMDQVSFVDRVRDAYSSLEAIYYESVAGLTRDHFDERFGKDAQPEEQDKAEPEKE